MPDDWPPVPAPDAGAAAAVAERRELLPIGALGVLGPVVDLLAGMRGSADRPVAPQRVRLALFAADHGVASLGLSAWEAGTTADRAAAMAGGTGPTAALAAAAGVGVRVVDVGIDAEAAVLAGAGIDITGRVRRGSGRIDHEDALTDAEVDTALEFGRRVADAEVDEGADLLIGAICGVGASTPVAVLTAAMTGMEPVDATTRGSGVDDAAWIRKAGAVRDALFRVRAAGGGAPTMLRTAGGADLAALTGFLAQSAIRRTPVLVHDVASTVCAVLAHRLAPGADAYVLAASLAPERGHRRLLEMLGVAPLVDWSLTADSGGSALLVVPALVAAARMVDAAPDEPPSRSASAIRAWDPGLL